MLLSLSVQICFDSSVLFEQFLFRKVSQKTFSFFAIPLFRMSYLRSFLKPPFNFRSNISQKRSYDSLYSSVFYLSLFSHLIILFYFFFCTIFCDFKMANGWPIFLTSVFKTTQNFYNTRRVLFIALIAIHHFQPFQP